MRWKIFDGTLDWDILIEFLRRLIKNAGRKIYLILDNLRVHHSKPVKAWLAEHKTEIEVFYLPSYSPELTPTRRPTPISSRRAPSCSWSRPHSGLDSNQISAKPHHPASGCAGRSNEKCRRWPWVSTDSHALRAHDRR
ncbi:hypothetical protein B0E49_16295 [Polaromonas sp. C04]|nr:hypothetical protein B0E49_16295 [Polaromonas sp. C04]